MVEAYRTLHTTARVIHGKLFNPGRILYDPETKKALLITIDAAHFFGHQCDPQAVLFDDEDKLLPRASIVCQCSELHKVHILLSKKRVIGRWLSYNIESVID